MAGDVSIQRRHASLLRQVGCNFFEIARAYGITPRVLCAWLNHEGAKQENDMYEGREPGPDENYSGKWPNEKEEMEQYLLYGVVAKDFYDPVLASKYIDFLEKLNSKTRKK